MVYWLKSTGLGERPEMLNSQPCSDSLNPIPQSACKRSGCG